MKKLFSLLLPVFFVAATSCNSEPEKKIKPMTVVSFIEDVNRIRHKRSDGSGTATDVDFQKTLDRIKSETKANCSGDYAGKYVKFYVFGSQKEVVISNNFDDMKAQLELRWETPCTLD